MRIIDADAHAVEPRDLFVRYIEPKYRERAPRIVDDARGHPWMAYRFEDERLGLEDGAVPAPPATGSPEPAERLMLRSTDPHARIQDLDADGIDVSVLYPSLGLYIGGVRDPEVAAACCRAYNDWLVEYCSGYPQRLLGMAALPLQDVDLAVKELHRAVERLGLKGAFVRPNPYNGRRLDDRAYYPLWAAAQDLGCPIGVHEGTTTTMPTAGGERYRDPYRLHVVSHVIEQMLACMDILTGGVLEAFPRLKLAFMETGGGWICSWLQRLDHQLEKAGRLAPPLALKPSEYFRRQCWISFDPGEMLLRPTVEWLGADRILWATDYPHFDGTFPGAVAEMRRTLEGFSDRDQARILGGNAAEFYGLA